MRGLRDWLVGRALLDLADALLKLPSDLGRNAGHAFLDGLAKGFVPFGRRGDDHVFELIPDAGLRSL